MTKNNKVKGYILAALAAATYGTNPAFAVPLYQDGMNPLSVLLFRYGFCIPILAVMLLLRHRSFRLHRNEVIPTVVLGILMAFSSLSLFESYNYMNSGVASTMLFIYPIMVALIMSLLFHERFGATTAICLIIMGIGLILLMHTEEGISISGIGTILVFISALTYAIYLVMTNVNKTVGKIATLKLLFWQFIVGTVIYSIYILCGAPYTTPSHSWGWINLIALAVLPSVVSLGFTTEAIHCIGSTPTAIFGALEPLTAVILSIFLLGQSLTGREIAGGLCIIIATTMVVASGPIDKIILRVRKMFPPIRRKHRF